MLYDMNNTEMLLGCFCNNPYLILQDKYKIDSDLDFNCPACEYAKFHKIIYRAIYNIANQGATEINGMMIDMFLQDYPTQLSQCQQFGLLDFIDTITQLANINNIDYHYNTVRKYSLLRYYKSLGFNISDIYDELKDDEDQNTKLSTMSIQDILDHFTDIQTQVKHKYSTQDMSVTHHSLGDNIDDSIIAYQEGYGTGLSFSNDYLNTLTHGYTGLTLRSGSTGAGKSMLLVADACKSGCEYLYDNNNNLIKNESFVGNILFINSELEFEMQIQPMFLAYVANVERNHIRHWKLTPEEKIRVNKAKEIISSHLYCVDIPDFTVSLIEETIDYYVHNYNIKMVCFDYVSINNSLSNEVNKLSKINNREDSVLLYLTRRLKEMSLKHNIPILSGTQLNRMAQEARELNEASLAGGISQLFKCDNVFAIKPLSREDYVDIEPYESIYNDTPPTHYITVLKARDSSYPKFTRVYESIDLGTGREKVLFCTTKDLDMLDIEKTYIKF